LVAWLRFEKINSSAAGTPKAFAPQLHGTGRLIATIAHPHLIPLPNKGEAESAACTAHPGFNLLSHS